MSVMQRLPEEIGTPVKHGSLTHDALAFPTLLTLLFLVWNMSNPLWSGSYSFTGSTARTTMAQRRMGLAPRITWQRPPVIRRAMVPRSLAFSTRTDKTNAGWTNLQLFASVAASAAVGYGTFRLRSAHNESRPALLSESRLPSVQYATLAQMEKVGFRQGT